ncbi:GPI mannosyltransferase 2 [Aspergillus japonicus CBS 114.51]|uniref:GPI mannosyltransferase 2 n=2 Tax=Aspergillus TaxID=5052 RepID=A0A2V5I1S2_ASPV1|nr:GPI mannosyltransferase 2 [Aspergillus japonicus CBS 114.51]PYI22460.1 GPI mannosyltransferase 2 [Aspergillus violaceofuscus CBS 115571]RAH85759.1 GPI mannosyltransferase 2 [Aspergillus japonicus CBS 114.51]
MSSSTYAGSRAANRPSILDPARPIRGLTIAFCLWKVLVFLVIVSCPGLGYDTSTSHLYEYHDPNSSDVISEDIEDLLLTVPRKFVRWDSIYFLHIAQQGYVFEQEWAFGYGYTQALAYLTSVLQNLTGLGGGVIIAIEAILLSHIAHYLSVLALYRLSVNVFGNDSTTQRLICLLSSALHIICPAGAFLSAPYGESLFSFLNITGFYLYSSAYLDNKNGKRLSGDYKTLLSAVLFSAATTVRSNGILSGILFAYDAFLQLRRVVSQSLSLNACAHLLVAIVSGCIIALGLILPQYIAHTAYCGNDSHSRPWCQWYVPSIYGWVQSQYWNVGFLRYWSLSNLPLFVLAMPMLAILGRSSFWALDMAVPFIYPRALSGIDHASSSATTASLLLRLAAPQGILALLALTSYHVQIINRIASGYPLWYWYLAYLVSGNWGQIPPSIQHSRTFTSAVQGMVTYALVQATLFGSFLPPA